MKILQAPDYNVFEAALAPLWKEQNELDGVPADKKRWAFTMEDDDQQLAGGIGGHIKWNWMYIQHLIVVPEMRGKGVGKALLAKAEQLARDMELKGIYLITLSYQAPAFYEREGFTVAGVIEDMPQGASMMTMYKRLRA